MKLLHAGSGGDPLPPWFGNVEEIRLDIDPGMRPDIVASMTDMGQIGDFDVVFCSHALEHLYPHEVPVALQEFRRVLRPGGYAMILVPDLEGVRPTLDVLYHSAAGPITGLDMIYGHAGSITKSPFMMHKMGFIQSTMKKYLDDAGFSRTEAKRIPSFNLLGVGIK